VCGVLVVCVEFVIKSRHLNEFLETLKVQAHKSIQEKECIRFDICQDLEDKGLVFLYEIYRDENAFKKHLSQNYFTIFSETTKPWIETKKVTKFSLFESHDKGAAP
jgi:quinol monooxygenase YgiN